MRNFYEQDKYRWEITDENGWDISKQEVRDNKINSVLDGGLNINLNYKLSLRKPDDGGYGMYVAYFFPREKKLSIYGLGDNPSVRVRFNSQDIEQCEKYVDLVCEGNDMEIMPVNIKS